MRKWVSVELEKKEAEDFKIALKKLDIRYQPSACYNLIHFEIYANNEEIKTLNSILESL